MINNSNICYTESDSNPESFSPEDECKSYEKHGKNNLCEFRSDLSGVRNCLYKERADYYNAVEYPSLIYLFIFIVIIVNIVVVMLILEGFKVFSLIFVLLFTLLFLIIVLFNSFIYLFIIF
jgi:hypothetical protein